MANYMCARSIRWIIAWILIISSLSNSAPSRDHTMVYELGAADHALEKRVTVQMEIWNENMHDIWKEMPTYIGFVPHSPFLIYSLENAKIYAKAGYLNIKDRTRPKGLKPFSFNSIMVAALMVKGKGIYLSSIPDGRGIGELRAYGAIQAPLHDAAAHGRGRGIEGIWHAEDSAAAQYEMRATNPAGPNNGYPQDSFMAVYGRYRQTEKPPYEKDKHLVGAPVSLEVSPEMNIRPCSTAFRNMPVEATCALVLMRLHVICQ